MKVTEGHWRSYRGGAGYLKADTIPPEYPWGGYPNPQKWASTLGVLQDIIMLMRIKQKKIKVEFYGKLKVLIFILTKTGLFTFHFYK